MVDAYNCYQKGSKCSCGPWGMNSSISNHREIIKMCCLCIDADDARVTTAETITAVKDGKEGLDYFLLFNLFHSFLPNCTSLCESTGVCSNCTSPAALMILIVTIQSVCALLATIIQPPSSPSSSPSLVSPKADDSR